MSSPPAPIRRLLFITVLLGALYFLGPQSIRDSGSSLVALIKPKPALKVDEIFGLLHLVADETEHVLTAVDPTEPVDLSVYAAGKQFNWNKEMKRLNEEHPVVVFSKSYCPYSRRAKMLLQSYNIQPPPKIIEVDLRDDSNVIKSLLTRLTRHSTFPNVIIQGKSIGGSDNLQGHHADKSLRTILEKAGTVVKYDGSGN